LNDKSPEPWKSIVEKEIPCWLPWRRYFPKKCQSGQNPEGGFYTWVTFPGEIDTEALLPRSIKDVSVAYGAGPAFYYDRSGKEHMRLSYSYVPDSQIEEGVGRLAAFMAENAAS
jgi:DNA-binding transcriptional MocR family regulator